MEITVQKGDTLWSLAARHLGDPMKWRRLYETNRTAIEREQRKGVARRAMIGSPDWIFPGTRLVLPETKKAASPPKE